MSPETVETYRAFRLAGPVDVRNGAGMWAIDTTSPTVRPVARCLGQADAERIVAALSALPVSGPTREEVARVVDPETFALIEHYNALPSAERGANRDARTIRAYPQLGERRATAYSRADQILALIPPAPQPSAPATRVGELEGALRELLDDSYPIGTGENAEVRERALSALGANLAPPPQDNPPGGQGDDRG